MNGRGGARACEPAEEGRGRAEKTKGICCVAAEAKVAVGGAGGEAKRRGGAGWEERFKIVKTISYRTSTNRTGYPISLIQLSISLATCKGG